MNYSSGTPDAITIISLVLGVLGLLVSAVALALAYVTFVNPRKRMDWYLRRPSGWEKVNLNLLGGHSIWRYKNHPEFVIEQTDEREPWSHGKTETWMKYPLPDPSKTTYMLHVKSGATVVYTELFITLDGGRYFVPLPRVKYNEKEKDNEYYYTSLQVQIARIVGTYYRMKSIDEFIKHNEIKVRETYEFLGPGI
ncbi:MAG: hypothetical protein WD887_01950 [Candidatus Saccharimonadales bacterium]